VTLKTSWFELRDAFLQLTPYSRPYLEMAAAATISPAGPRAAGKYGLGLLSIGATTQGGFNALAMTHQIWSEKAAEHGNVADRESWRLVGPLHVAETREKARENVRFGIGEWLRYFQEVGALPLAPAGSLDNAIEALTKSGLAVIGTPDDAIAQLQRLEEQSGGFGCFLQLAHNWADFENTKRSYELIARYVMPRFQELNPNRVKSMEWATKQRPALMGAVTQAIGNEIQKHAQEQIAKRAKEKD